MTQEGLTLENFAASLLWQISHPEELPVRWLCASEEHKNERRALLKIKLQEWQQGELKAKEGREKIRSNYDTGRIK